MIKDDTVDPNGPWTDDDLKEWGKIVRETLRLKWESSISDALRENRRTRR